jgi:hypothetical protein
MKPLAAKFIALNDELEKIDFQERPVAYSQKEKEVLEKIKPLPAKFIALNDEL